jgi:hypothetical protein
MWLLFRRTVTKAIVAHSQMYSGRRLAGARGTKDLNQDNWIPFRDRCLPVVTYTRHVHKVPQECLPGTVSPRKLILWAVFRRKICGDMLVERLRNWELWSNHRWRYRVPQLFVYNEKQLNRATVTNKNKTNSVALSPRGNYIDWATATCRRNYCQLLWIEGRRVVNATDPLGH